MQEIHFSRFLDVTTEIHSFLQVQNMLEHHTVHVNWHMGLVVKNISQYCKSILYLINCGWAYYHFNVALFFFITKNLIPFLIFFSRYIR